MKRKDVDKLNRSLEYDPQTVEKDLEFALANIPKGSYESLFVAFVKSDVCIHLRLNFDVRSVFVKSSVNSHFFEQLDDCFIRIK